MCGGGGGGWRPGVTIIYRIMTEGRYSTATP